MPKTETVTFLRDYPHHDADGERLFSAGTKTVPLAVAELARARGYIGPAAVAAPPARKRRKA